MYNGVCSSGGDDDAMIKKNTKSVDANHKVPNRVIVLITCFARPIYARSRTLKPHFEDLR